MTDKLKPCKCPKSKYMARAFDVHFDCLDCPIPTCCAPSIRDNFLKEKEKDNDK